MVNSKGGFLVEDDTDANAELRAKEKERERERTMQSLAPRQYENGTENVLSDEQVIQPSSLTPH